MLQRLVEGEDAGVPQPPRLQLSSERVDSHGLYLLDDGSSLLLYIGHNIPPAACQAVFHVPHFSAIPHELVSIYHNAVCYKTICYLLLFLNFLKYFFNSNILKSLLYYEGTLFLSKTELKLKQYLEKLKSINPKAAFCTKMLCQFWHIDVKKGLSLKEFYCLPSSFK